MAPRGAPENALRGAFVEAQEPGGASCPDETMLAALALSELPPPQASSIADHAVSCRRCSAALRDLLDLHDAVRPDASSFSRSAWSLAAAAALLVAGIALSYYARQARPPIPLTSSTERGAAAATFGVDPPDGAMLGAAPERLAWAESPNAEAYSVVLYDAESTPVWESPSFPTPRIPIPPDVRGRLGEGRYFWRGTWLEGIERTQTPLCRFTISPPRK